MLSTSFSPVSLHTPLWRQTTARSPSTLTIAALNTPGAKPSAIRPSDLASALSRVSLRNGTRSLLGAHQQQDAHELLVLLTSAVEEELAVVKTYRGEMLRLSRGGLRAALPLVSQEEPAGRSDPVNVFRGLTAQRTSCYTCGYTEAIRHYAFDELSLNVPSYACTLEHCLQKWEEVEEVEWVCHSCSLRKTLDRLSGECARLEGKSAIAETLRSNGNGHAAQHFDARLKQQMNGDAADASSGGDKMSASKKKRLKEARKLESRVRAVLAGRMHEDEASESGLLEGIKLDRTPSLSATKHVMLARAPQVLAVHLNRSSYFGGYGASKNEAPVRFGETLDLRPFLTGGEMSTNADEPISEMAPLDGFGGAGASASATAAQQRAIVEDRMRSVYRLRSVVVHLGRHSFGHYVAFRRRPTPRSAANGRGKETDDEPAGAQTGLGSTMGIGLEYLGAPSLGSDEWLYISDERVSPCSLDEVLRQSAFLLFYERVLPPASQDGGLAVAAPQQTNGHAHDAGHLTNGAALGFENLAGPRSLRMKALMQPKVVPRWSVEPESRGATPAPED